MLQESILHYRDAFTASGGRPLMHTDVLIQPLLSCDTTIFLLSACAF
jgi:hypothetical protein